MQTPASSPQESTPARPVALVTGASSGIGAATALALCRAGYDVVAGARRADRLAALEAQADGATGTLVPHALDVRVRDSMEAFAQAALSRFGRIDVLVNNAGVMPLSPLAALRVDEWDWTLDVNVRGVLHGIAAVLPTMETQGRGHVVNIASIGARRVWAGCAVYCASKYAVRAISEGLRQESTSLRVTVVSPGPVETELAGTISDPTMREAMVDYRRDAIPAEAIANAVLFAVQQPPTVDVSEIVVNPTAFVQ